MMTCEILKYVAGQDVIDVRVGGSSDPSGLIGDRLRQPGVLHVPRLTPPPLVLAKPSLTIVAVMPMYDAITSEQRELLESADLFFVASVAPDLSLGRVGEGPVNVSPKGGKVLVIDDHTVAYLDYKGSGNETARHGDADGPLTLMVMSFDVDAAIVRLYGNAIATPLDESPLADQLPGQDLSVPKRQVVTVTVSSTQTSCGYGVPVYKFVGNRTTDQRGRRFK